MGLAISPSRVALLDFHLLGRNHHPKLYGARRRCLEDFCDCDIALRLPRPRAEQGNVYQSSWNPTSQCEGYESEMAPRDWMEALGRERRVLPILIAIPSLTTANGLNELIEFCTVKDCYF